MKEYYTQFNRYGWIETGIIKDEIQINNNQKMQGFGPVKFHYTYVRLCMLRVFAAIMSLENVHLSVLSVLVFLNGSINNFSYKISP